MDPGSKEQPDAIFRVRGGRLLENAGRFTMQSSLALQDATLMAR
jgi:hypothetical protein